MRLVAYARTSSGNGNGDSLDAQEDACRTWTAQHGHEIVKVEQDDGVSGGLPVDERPGLLAAIVEVEEGRAEGIVVHRIDRFARELHVQEAALARIWGISDHTAVFEAVEGEIKRDDPEDPQRRFLRQVMGAATKLEKGLIKARLRRGRRRKAARGGYIGGTRRHRPYGRRLAEQPDGRREYEPVPEEQAVIATMRAMRADGATLQAVCDELTREGVLPPSGARWHPGTIHRILAHLDAAA